MAELVAQAGFEWMATDEGILEKSGVHVYDGSRHRLYQPYRRNNITIFFRDRTLSDLIGFNTCTVPPATARTISCAG